MLEDRIRIFEDRPQLYGTQLKPDAHGNMQPTRLRIRKVWTNDVARRVSNLSPKFVARAKPQPLPADPERFEHDYQNWLIEVGWRARSQ